MIQNLNIIFIKPINRDKINKYGLKINFVILN